MSEGIRALARSVQVQHDKLLYGMTNFSAANHLATAAAGGETGDAAGYVIGLLGSFSALPSGTGILLGKAQPSSQLGWEIYHANADLTFASSSGAGVWVSPSVHRLLSSDLNRIHLLLLYRDAIKVRAWIDSEQKGDGAFILGHTATPSLPLDIGSVAGIPASASFIWYSSVMFRGTPSVARLRAYANLVRLAGDLPLSMPQVTATEADVSALSPLLWLRADSTVQSGGAVTAINNRVSSDQLTSTGAAMGLPVSEPLLGGALTLSFTGTQHFTSTLSPSAWRLLHDGSGYELWHVLIPRASGIRIIMSTRPGTGYDIGMSHYWNPAHALAVGNGAANIFAPIAEANPIALNVPVALGASYKQSEGSQGLLLRHSGVALSAIAAGAPSASNPFATLRLGAASDGNYGADMAWAESILIPYRTSEAERGILQSYLCTRYPQLEQVTVTHQLSTKIEVRSSTAPMGRKTYGVRKLGATAHYASASPGGIAGAETGMWIGWLGNFEAVPTTTTMIFHRLTYPTGWYLTALSNALRFIVGGAALTQSPAYTIVPADLNRPFAALGHYDGTNVHLWVNRVYVGSAAKTSSPGLTAAATAMIIGQYGGGQDFSFGSAYGVVGGTGVTLTNAEINAWFDATQASGQVAAIPNKTSGRWPLGDASGVLATVVDTTGTSGSLTKQGAGALEQAVYTAMAPASPSQLTDQVTRAAVDAAIRQGSPTMVARDTSLDGRRTLGVQGFAGTSRFESAPLSTLVASTGTWWSLYATPWSISIPPTYRGLICLGLKLRFYVTNGVQLQCTANAGTTAPQYNLTAAQVGQPIVLTGVYNGASLEFFVNGVSTGEPVAVSVADGTVTMIVGSSESYIGPADSWSYWGVACGRAAPTASEVFAHAQSTLSLGRMQSVAGKTEHVLDPTTDMLAAGETVPAQILDQIGTAHLSNAGAVVLTRGGAKGVRLCVSSPTTGGRIAPYYRTLTSAGGLAGIASALHVSAKITVENQNAQNNHTLVSTFSTSPSNSGFILALNTNNTSLIFAIYAGGATQSSAAYTVPANKVGAPLHVDGVFTGAAIQLFVDGVQIGSDVAASYTPSTSATYVGVDARDLAVTAAENVSIHAVSGGNTVITSGEIAARYAASVAAGSLQQVAGKTQRHWPIETDAASGQVPGVSAERTGAGDPLMLVGAPLQLAQRTERGWGYETSPVFQGATGFANGAYFAGSQGLCVGDQNGFFELWAFVLWPTLTSTSRVIASARDDVAYYGCQIYTTGANGMLICTCGTTAGNDVSTSPNAVASHELGKIMIAGFTVNPAAGQLQGFARRTSLVSGGFTGGAYYRPKPSLSRMVGRRSVDSYPAQDITILGGWYGQGILTLAEYQAIYDDFFATERVQRVIPKVTNAWDIRASAMPNGGIIPAQIPDLVGSVPLATYGTLSLQSIYSRAAAA